MSPAATKTWQAPDISEPSQNPLSVGGSASIGKTVYVSRCISCHNQDPKKSGSLGPDVWGSSLELLEAKIIKGQYPAGYKPKRSSKMMVPIPDLKDKLTDLHTYLNTASP